ncbi:MAG: GIY-YIG nuclease family protein [Gammaproteobacteria bacterium]|nr:GIY-YIG nuclease family protein [Gammaproteobacteria bacterium]
MATLTADQHRFLEQQQIPVSRVFDATGMRTRDWKAMMHNLGFDVAYGVTPCSNGGHTLRTRYGHCVQCGTHNLAFLRRYDAPGEVYVAASSQISLRKIGTSKNANERISFLNRESYGGASDWRLRHVITCNQAGRVEFVAQRKVQPYRKSRSYNKAGVLTACLELFDCPVEVAIIAVNTAAKDVAGYSPSVNKRGQRVGGGVGDFSGPGRKGSADNASAGLRQSGQIYKVYKELVRIPSPARSQKEPQSAKPTATHYTVYKETVRVPSSRTSPTADTGSKNDAQVRSRPVETAPNNSPPRPTKAVGIGKTAWLLVPLILLMIVFAFKAVKIGNVVTKEARLPAHMQTPTINPRPKD